MVDELSFALGDLVEYRALGSLKKFGIYLGYVYVNDDDRGECLLMFLGPELDYISKLLFEAGELMIAVRSSLEEAEG